jgi:carboxyl-terminal processing protease
MDKNKLGSSPIQGSAGMNAHHTDVSGVPRAKRLRNAISIIIVLLITFGAGVGVGGGHVALPSNRKSVSGLPSQLDYTTVNEVYKSLTENYNGKLTESQVLDGIKTGLAQSTKDPYTEYFTAAQAKDFSSQLNNSFSGIGAELGKDAQSNLVVVSPISGFPADKAGLKPKDIIAEIDGTSTTGMSIDAAVSKIHGPAGTKVTLSVVRDGSPLTFDITRANIQIPSVNSKMLDNNIGYIQIITFADDTSALIKQTALKMKQANVKGIVLDLRGNPGGEVSAAVDVASEWLPQGKPILQEKRGNTVINTDTATGNNSLLGVPTAVLIDAGSASASEITAGALHDNNTATLIGAKSYGKGVVQQLISFGDGSELKVTIASWYRPNGQNINKKGITPDQNVPITDADAKAGNDSQLQAAQTFLNK